MSTSEDCDGQFFLTWEELRDQLFADGASSFVWRGVANAEWCVKSSLDRFAEANRIADRASLTGRLLDLFREHLAEIYDNPVVSDDHLWALGQHLGLPTPLLDWSRSPMVALFFSVTAGDPDVDLEDRTGCVYRLKFDSPFLQVGDVRAFTPLAGPWNVRLRAQQGIFTSMTVKGCLIDLLRERNQSANLFAYTFPALLRDEIMHDLALMMIDDLHLYPDSTGIIRHVRSQAMRLGS